MSPRSTNHITPTASTRRVLTPEQAQEVIRACGPLGPDPSSRHFTRRCKSIAYVMRIGTEWFQLRANFFVQPERYNDFSGGYRRHFDELDGGFLDNPAARTVLDTFSAVHGIADQELILVQVQSSEIRADDPHRSLTGQGIHTDGHDRAMLLCLDRHNIVGAENAIHENLSGSRPVIEPFVLQPGEMLVWKDNEVFHDVTAADPIDPDQPAWRTVMLAHHPAAHSLTGAPNENNTLGTALVAPERRLRNRSDLHHR